MGRRDKEGKRWGRKEEERGERREEKRGEEKERVGKMRGISSHKA